MRPMKDGAHPAERDANPAAGPFADFGAGGPEQAFYFIPSKIGRDRLSENSI